MLHKGVADCRHSAFSDPGIGYICTSQHMIINTTHHIPHTLPLTSWIGLLTGATRLHCQVPYLTMVRVAGEVEGVLHSYLCRAEYEKASFLRVYT
jgi:hypothetical protein